MRPIYFYGAMTLDGYLATNDDELQWLFDTPLNDQSTYPQFETLIDTLVMGRVTYDTTKKLLNGAPFYPDQEKIIFSRSRITPLEKGRYVSGDPIPILRTLQQQPGKGIWIVGGGDLVTAALITDLITEMWIQIAPVLLGSGKPLFPQGNYAQRFELLATTQMGQLTELHLQRH